MCRPPGPRSFPEDVDQLMITFAASVHGRFTRGAKFVEVDWLDDKIIWAGQDECHGFIFENYPVEVVLPLLSEAQRRK
jgi:hypothetical protein